MVETAHLAQTANTAAEVGVQVAILATVVMADQQAQPRLALEVQGEAAKVAEQARIMNMEVAAVAVLASKGKARLAQPPQATAQVEVVALAERMAAAT